MSLKSRKDFINDLQKMSKYRTDLRSKERSLSSQEKLLNQMPVIASDDLASNLGRVLPSHLVPTNVGKLDQIMKPQFYKVSFDNIGNNPTYGPDFRELASFQVKQEAAFLLTSISRSYKSGDSAGFGAPLQLDVRDNQSSRQYNDAPVSIQHIGSKAEPLNFDVPKLFMPNASVSIILSSWLPADQATVGDGYQEFIFGGYRVPVGDAKLLLNSILV